MQRLEVSCAVRLIYRSLGVKGLNSNACEAVKELRRASGLRPSETLRVGSTPLGRLVGRERMSGRAQKQ